MKTTYTNTSIYSQRLQDRRQRVQQVKQRKPTRLKTVGVCNDCAYECVRAGKPAQCLRQENRLVLCDAEFADGPVNVVRA